jgi:hypothetical protein
MAEAGQPIDIAVSLLHAVEDSLHAFERHHELILKCTSMSAYFTNSLKPQTGLGLLASPGGVFPDVS